VISKYAVEWRIVQIDQMVQASAADSASTILSPQHGHSTMSMTTGGQHNPTPMHAEGRLLHSSVCTVPGLCTNWTKSFGPVWCLVYIDISK